MNLIISIDVDNESDGQPYKSNHFGDCENKVIIMILLLWSHFYSRKGIWKCRPQNGGHPVQVSLC